MQKILKWKVQDHKKYLNLEAKKTGQPQKCIY